MEQHKRRKCKLKNHMILKMEQLKRRRYDQRNHKTLEQRVKKEKNHRQFKNRKRWRLFQQQKSWKYNRKLNYWGRRLKLWSQKQIQNHWFFYKLKIQNCNRGDKCLKRYIILSFHFCHFMRISRIESKVQRGQDEYMILDKQGRQDRDSLGELYWFEF